MDGVKTGRRPCPEAGNLYLPECLAAFLLRSPTRGPARACPRFMSYISTNGLFGLCISTRYDELVSSQDGSAPGCHLTFRRPTFLPMNIEPSVPTLFLIKVQVKETKAAKPRQDTVGSFPCSTRMYLPGTCRWKSKYRCCKLLTDLCSSVSIPSLTRSGKKSEATTVLALRVWELCLLRPWPGPNESMETLSTHLTHSCYAVVDEVRRIRSGGEHELQTL